MFSPRILTVLNYVKILVLKPRRNRFEETTSDVAFTPVSGWLGSGADEGRAKLR